MRRFLIGFSISLILLFFYTGIKTIPFFPGQRFFTWVLLLLFFTLMMGYPFAHHHPFFQKDSLPLQLLAWTSNITMGFWATWIFFSLPFDGLFLLAKIVKIFIPEVPIEKVRTLLWLRIPPILLVFSFFITGLGLLQALRVPVVKTVSLRFPKLPPGMKEVVIAQISDLHASPTLRRSKIERIVDRILELKPDAIAFTGDLADGTVESLKHSTEPLKKLAAPLGVFFVTGNHEYYWKADQWITRVRELGMIPLVNENRTVEFSGAKILIAGITDTSSGQFIPSHQSDPQQAVRSVSKTDLKILLAHRPKSCFEAAKAGFDLQLSGHVHGGQFFPFTMVTRLFEPYIRGLYRLDQLWLYVNVGTGYWGPPNRFANPAEITVFRIQSE